MSSEIFQKWLQKALDGLEGVNCIADDVLVYGTRDNKEMTQEDHDRKLEKLLRGCTEQGIDINKQKLELNTKQMTFLGHRLTSKWLVVDPGKVKAIMEMSPPKNGSRVPRQCGMVIYKDRFLPGILDVMGPTEG